MCLEQRKAFYSRKECQKTEMVRLSASGVHDHNCTIKKLPLSPKKEDKKDDQTEEGDETVEPAQAPPAFDEGGQATLGASKG